MSKLTIIAALLAALPLVACGGADDASSPVDLGGEDTTEDALKTGTTFHGTVSVTEDSVDDPDARLKTPFAWDVGTKSSALVLPATLDPSHPAHSWDIEVKEDTRLDVMSAAIKLFKNGKPDVKDFHVSWLYKVKDVDTVMTIFKKEGSSYKFVAKNDDGISESKGSWVQRVLKKGTYHIVVASKDPSTTGNVGLFVESLFITPPEP